MIEKASIQFARVGNYDMQCWVRNVHHVKQAQHTHTHSLIKSHKCTKNVGQKSACTWFRAWFSFSSLASKSWGKTSHSHRNLRKTCTSQFAFAWSYTFSVCVCSPECVCVRLCACARVWVGVCICVAQGPRCGCGKYSVPFFGNSRCTSPFLLAVSFAVIIIIATEHV